MGPRCHTNAHLLMPFLYPVFRRAVCRPRSQVVKTADAVRRAGSDANTASWSRLNPSPDDYSMPNFADKAKLKIRAGGGGNGCISFQREAFMPEGPANGGDGGHGGNVYIQAVHGETSLHKLARRNFVRAGAGKSGRGSSKGGQRGEDVVIMVPVGTVLRELSRFDPEAESAFLYKEWRRRRRKAANADQESVADENQEPAEEPGQDKWLLHPGLSTSESRRIELPRFPSRDRLFPQPRSPIQLDLSRPTPQPILLAAGGLGGLGNPHFVNKERPRPLIATKGERAMSMEVELELRLLADVGLVGLPNAGKSTLLRALTNSRARVGNWAFTTLQPNIGTVVLDTNRGRPLVTSYRKRAMTTRTDAFAVHQAADSERELRTRFTVADIPGLVEGAHLDKGLGIAFLRHVERAGVLAFVVDLSAGDAVKALEGLWKEVGLYAQMREDEERDRERQARVDWSAEAGTRQDPWQAMMTAVAEPPYTPPPAPTGLHIASKPWFVVATKGDKPDTQENFTVLRDHLDQITRGDVPHPSGVEGAWTQNCTAIAVSAINGHGVERIVHWTVGLLDG